MTGALKHSESLAHASNPAIAGIGEVASEYAGGAGTLALPKARFDEALPSDLTFRHYVTLGLAAVLVHAVIVIAYVHRDQSASLPVRPHHVEIEFIKPVAPEKKIVEPPPPPPPPPKLEHHVAPKPASTPAPALKTAPAEQNIPHDALTVAENTEAVKTSGPVEAAPQEPPAPPPPPKVEEPIVEPDINAAYRNNPPADYPAFAVRQGWEGTVLLHVHILASGKTDKVDVKQSSGRKTLDDAAQSAVRNWTFDPIRRGSKPIDGWVTVPIVFKLSK
jgi:protein TonB